MYSEIGSQTSVRELAGTLYRDQRNYLLRVARHNALNEAHAEEALQEAFAAFLRAFDPNGGAPPLAWLTLTLKRECWRKRRDEHLDRRIGQEAERHGEEAGLILELIPAWGPSLEDRVGERDQARRRLRRLKPDERTGLGFLAAGFSYREIAQRRGWTYTKVNRCISEGRAALREVAAA